MIKQISEISILFSLVFFFSSTLTNAQSLIINEVCPSNNKFILDEDGDDPDWIELFNNSNSQFDLSAYYISDTKDELDKWKLPSLNLQPNEYLLIFASGKDRYNLTNHWETIIDAGDAWNYLLPQSEPLSSWKEVGFDDSFWNVGSTGIGYGDDDDSTVIQKTISLFARKTFNISDTSTVNRIVFHIDYDDGFIAYLNGIEFARVNLGPPNSTVSYNQTASANHEAQIYSGGSPERFNLGKSLLKEGENVIAVQVHNVSSTSSDLSFIPFLSLGLTEEPENAAGSNDLLDLIPLTSHANFSIKASGDEVYLTKENIIQDSLIYPQLAANITFGRVSGNLDSLVYFSEPTPGEENSDNNYPGVSPAIIFNNEGGIYHNAIDLELSTDGEAEIYFTTNGDEPTTGSKKYESTILLSQSTVIKAKSFVDGYLPSPTVVNTFIFNKNSSLPVLSISTDSLNLWDYSDGIYVMGPNASNSNPYFGANFWQDWEKPAHIEFFNQYGEKEYFSGCGIKIYGGWSRAFAQKSLAVFFRGEYGNSVLEYQLFPDLPYDEYESFVLRNSGNDWQYTMMRDGLMQNIAKNVDVDYLEFRPAILYLNGEYWGIHNLREKVNEDYLARRHGIDPDKVDIIESDLTVVEGSAEEYLELKEYMANNSLSDPTAYNYVTDRIDVNEFINYFILNTYFVNLDWPGNNIKCWKTWKEDSKWRWFLYDTDFGFGLYDRSNYQFDMFPFITSTNGPSHPNPPWSTFLLRRLLMNSEFEGKFIDRIADLSNTYFKPSFVTNIIDSLRAAIENEIPDHSERWGQFSPNAWRNQEVDYLRFFAENRASYLRVHASNFFNLGGITQITLQNEDPSKGSIKVNSVIINESEWKGFYFTDRSVKLTALPKTGFRFSHWSGQIESASPEISIDISTVAEVTAVFEISESESSPVVINEINYHSIDEFDTGDWVELYNNTENEIDLSKWVFKDEDLEHSFVIPEGVHLSSGEYFVLCEDIEKFSLLYPDVTNVIGNFEFGLSNDGETIYLLNQINAVIDSVAYDDEFPWTADSDGNGHSLELINPDIDNNLAESWGASISYGSPAQTNGLFTSISDNDKTIPTTYELSQNYPNPFNPSTIIKFTIPTSPFNPSPYQGEGNRERLVSLIVYNILGQEVKTLINKQLKPGKYEIEFNASELPSGVYFYRLNAGSFTESRKMLLLK